MSRRNQDRLSQQAKQIETLFRDFKKMLGKCRELAKELRVQLPNDALYNTIERTTLMKVSLLDLPGLVNLKNSIAKTTSQLFDQERDLAYKKQKKEVKERIERENPRRRDSTEKPKESKEPQSQPSQSRMAPPNQRPAQSLDSLRSSRSSDILRQSKSIEIPIYKAKVETAEGKMDRISKYIASLKKNIKANAEASGGKWRVKDYLLTQPTYVKAKTLLQRYLMREEEIERVVSQAVRSKIQQFFTQSDTVTMDENFYYVKVKKPPKSTKQIPSEKNSPTKQSQKHLSTIPQQINGASKPSAQASPVQKQAEMDFEQMKAEIQKKEENYAEMFNKMTEVVEIGAQRLSEFRQKRIQAFQSDEAMWDELDS